MAQIVEADAGVAAGFGEGCPGQVQDRGAQRRAVVAGENQAEIGSGRSGGPVLLLALLMSLEHAQVLFLATTCLRMSP